MPELIEQRHHPRIAFDRPVLLHSHATGNRLLRGRVRDLSASGMLVEIADVRQLSISTEVRAAFKIGQGLGILPSVVVRHQDDQRLALCFTEPASEAWQMVESILGRHALAKPIREQAN